MRITFDFVSQTFPKKLRRTNSRLHVILILETPALGRN